jgi:hypothetical protein
MEVTHYKGYLTMTDRADITDPPLSLAYYCGWVFALLESAGIIHEVARDYLLASQSPATYFGPVIARLFPRQDEARQTVDEQLIEVIGLMPGTDWPGKLTLEEQGQFALGYWQHKGKIDVTVRITRADYEAVLPLVEQHLLSVEVARMARTVSSEEEILRSEQTRHERLEQVVTLTIDRGITTQADKLHVKTSMLLRVALQKLADAQRTASRGSPTDEQEVSQVKPSPFATSWLQQDKKEMH